MRKIKPKSILCLVLIVLLCVLDSCAYRPRPARDAEGNVLFRLGFSGTPAALNPYAVCDREGEAVLSLLYDRLFVPDPETGECVGSLCTDYSVRKSKAGGMLWSITLRDDVYWHDGEKLTASDVEFTLQSMKDVSALYGYPACELLDTTGIAVSDETHLDMIVWGEEGYIRQCLATIPILPRHIWNQSEYMHYNSSGVAADPLLARTELGRVPADAAHMVGSGLYVWNGYEDGVCSLKLNAEYWNGTSRAEAVELRFGREDPAGELAAGELDGCWDMSLNAFQSLWEDKSFRVSSGTTGELYLLNFNYQRQDSPVRDVRVRRAVDHCTNRGEILLRAFGGGYAQRTMLSPFSPWDYSPFLGAIRPYDVSAAAQLLESAGYRDSDGDGIREGAGGKKLTLTVACSAGSDAWQTAAQILAASCRKAGIELAVTVVSPAMISEALASGRCDAVLSSVGTWPEPWFSLGTFYWNGGDNAFSVSDGRGGVASRGWNESGYANETYDNTYRRLLTAVGDESLRTLTAQAGEILYDDAAAIPLGFAVRYQGWSTVWSGLQPDRRSGLLFAPSNLARQMQNLSTGGK